MQQCSEKSTKGVKCFWSHVNSRVKKSTDINAVLSPASNSLKCNPEDIKLEVEQHLLRVFNGSFYPIESNEQPLACDHNYSKAGDSSNDSVSDHT